MRLSIALRELNQVVLKYLVKKSMMRISGVIRYDENGNPQAIASTKQRAEELFEVKRKSYNLF